MCGGAQKAKRAGAAVTDLSKSQKVAHMGPDKRGPSKDKWCSGQSGMLVWESCGGRQGFKTSWWQTFLLFLWGHGQNCVVLHHQTKQKHDRIHSGNWVETSKAMQTAVA